MSDGTNTLDILDSAIKADEKLPEVKDAAKPASSTPSDNPVADLDNIITGPEVSAGTELSPDKSLARDLIVKYVPGKDPNKDALLDKNEWVFGPQFTSRDWANRKAKKAAKELITDPEAGFNNITTTNIWKHVLRAEGGYVNDPDDPGGETKYGISKRSYPEEDIANMTIERAQEIFERDFYGAVGGDSLLKINPGLAAHVSDMAFNAGPRTAVKLLYDAVQLPRKNQITPELLDKLNESENLIKDYSVARLKYYSGLKNAPKYIKGWVNRVNNLNKALKVKSGLRGAYRAAKKLDVETLVQQVYSTQEQLAPKFRALDKVEVERLSRANEMLAPGYKRPASEPQKEVSGIGDVFKATYDAKYYTNTIDGMNELAMRAARSASEANRKALGDKFDESIIESLTGGLYGGIGSVEDFEAEVKKLKEKNPDVKLPFDSADKVYELMQTRAKEIEDAYNKVDSGSFSDGIYESVRKLGHVVAGYLPGEILGSMSDRLEGAINLIPLPGATSAVNVAKGALGVMAGVGATQAVVQPKRQDLGLEGGLAQGALNTAAAGLGQAVLGGAASLGSKLFRSGSKQTAELVADQADKLKKVVDAEEATPDSLHLKKTIEDLEEHAKEYLDNPYGDSFEAKSEYEATRKAAFDDLVDGKPVREISKDPVKVPDTSKELKSQFSQMAKEIDSNAYTPKDIEDGVALWNSIKKKGMVEAKDFQSTVPVETPEGNLQVFPTKEEAKAFIKGDPNLTVLPNPSDDGGYYIARSADLELADSASSRMQEGAKEIEVKGKKVFGFEDSEDLKLAEKYPDHTEIREVKKAEAPEPKYGDVDATEPHREFLAKAEEVPIEKKLEDLDTNVNNYFKDIVETDPDRIIDLGDESETLITAKDLFDEVSEERTVLDEMFSCMSNTTSSSE